MIIEGFSFIDSLYMTVITVATVGYGEVKQLSLGGKIFTIFLIISSLGTFAYAISLISTYFIEGQLRSFVKGYFKKTVEKKMNQHVIICGFGRNGKQAAKGVIAHGKLCVVIDNNIDISKYENTEQQIFVEGDATEDETLIRAGIKKATSLISTLPYDADNLYVVLTARNLNPDIKIVSRATDQSAEKKLRMAGVDSIVMPERVGGNHMATLTARPDVVEFLEHLSIYGKDPTKLEEIECSNIDKNFKGLTIYELGVRKKTGANIIGFKTPEGEYILNPTPDTIMRPDSKLFVLGTPEQIKEMKKILSHKKQEKKLDN